MLLKLALVWLTIRRPRFTAVASSTSVLRLTGGGTDQPSVGNLVIDAEAYQLPLEALGGLLVALGQHRVAQ